MSRESDYREKLESRREEMKEHKRSALENFASHCDLHAMRCKYGQTAEEWAQRAEIVRDYIRQTLGQKRTDNHE